MTVSFGDNVKIRSAPETEARGLAGRVGNVFGETTPSVTGVEVIGGNAEDFAFNVFFEELNKGFWFAPHLVESVDHAAGTEITLDGVDKKWTRAANGEWIEQSTKPDSIRSASAEQRPWWKFWRR